jgi:hypothetical protein
MTEAYKTGFYDGLEQNGYKQASESAGMNISNNIVQRASTVPGFDSRHSMLDVLDPEMTESARYPKSIELGKRLTALSDSEGADNPFSGFSNPELSAYGYNLDADTGLGSDIPSVDRPSSWDMQTAEWLRDPEYVDAVARALTPAGTNLLSSVAAKQGKPARLDKVDESLGKGNAGTTPTGFVRTPWFSGTESEGKRYSALFRLLSGLWRGFST